LCRSFVRAVTLTVWLVSMKIVARVYAAYRMSPIRGSASSFPRTNNTSGSDALFHFGASLNCVWHWSRNVRESIGPASM